MTAIAIWYEKADDLVWAVADTRIGFGAGTGMVIRTDAASKLLPLQVFATSRLHGDSREEALRFETTFGFDYAGDTLSALMTYSKVSAFSTNLIGLPATSPPSLFEIASMAMRVGIEVGRHVAESKNAERLGLSVALCRWCPVQKRFQAASLVPAVTSLRFDLGSVCLEHLVDPVVLGSGGQDLLSEFHRLRIEGDKYGRTARLPKIALENLVKEMVREDVGGELLVGASSRGHFRLYQYVRPVVWGQPQAIATFSGSNANEQVGDYMIGIAGIA